jgi:hypothetical protein
LFVYAYYSKVLEIAPILDRSDTPILDGIRAQRQSGNGRHALVDTALGAPDGAFIMGDTGLRDFWCSPDPADSVRDAQALLKIRFRLGGRLCIKQQYSSLTTCLHDALPGRTDQKAMGTRQ